jgi:hypothetical protein
VSDEDNGFVAEELFDAILEYVVRCVVVHGTAESKKQEKE